MLQRTLVFTLVLIGFFGCKQKTQEQKSLATESNSKQVKYAQGFTVIDYGSHKILEIKKPWQNADKTFKYALVKTSHQAHITLNKDEYDAIVTIPIKSIVVTSTTHIPALELLGEETSLIGFPETNYISSKKTRQRIDNGSVSELGKNEGINTEVLLQLNPNLVVGFGIDGSNKTFDNIKKAGIPVIYNGDWMETSPLAKAEWIKFFGALYDKEKEADSIFNEIETNYVIAKKLAQKAQNKPTVLSGAMHKDIWYLPNGNSTEAKFLEDANVNYLWSITDGSGSLALNFESVFDRAKNADIWLNPSNLSSYEALEKANAHYTKFDAYRNRNIYTINNTVGETGGVLYYELGTTRPDWILKDIIKICHPELLENYQPFFFKPLN